MKKGIGIISMLVVFSVIAALCCSCSSTSSASTSGLVSGPTSTKITYSDFTISTSRENNNTILSFVAQAGIEGDGYAIYIADSGPYESRPYFLPEGQTLILPDNEVYAMTIYRIFYTDKGMVKGCQGLNFTNNTSSNVTGPGSLSYLTRIESIYSPIYEPKVVIKPNTGKFFASPNPYQNTPPKYDRIKYCFVTSETTQATQQCNYASGAGGDNISFLAGYAILTISGQIDDTLHDRVIETPTGIVYYQID